MLSGRLEYAAAETQVKVVLSVCHSLLVHPPRITHTTVELEAVACRRCSVSCVLETTIACCSQTAVIQNFETYGLQCFGIVFHCMHDVIGAESIRR